MSRPESSASWDDDVLRRLGPATEPTEPANEPTEPTEPSEPATAPPAGRHVAAPDPAPPEGPAPGGDPAPSTGSAAQDDDEEDPGVSPWETRRARRLAGRPGTTRLRRGWASVAGVFGSDDEPERRTRATAACQTAVSTGRRIAVVAAHGGAGATSVAAGLGMALAATRNDHVAVVAGRDDRQTLQHRLGCTRPTAADAVVELLVAHSIDPNIAMLGHLDVPGVERLRAVTRGEDPATVALCADHLARRHAVTLVDVGADTHHPVLASAHCVVVVARLSLDGVAQAHAALGELAAQRRTRAQVVLVDVGAETGLDLVGAQRLLRGYAAPVTALGPDRHLAAGTRVSYALLAPATSLSLTEVAATALEQATGAVRRERR